jgi:hypothetical protein
LSALEGGASLLDIEGLMARDIDYAATAVNCAIVETFRTEDLGGLQVSAGDRTIALCHTGRRAEGTRDDLLAAIRKATSFANLWDVLRSEGLLIR